MCDGKVIFKYLYIKIKTMSKEMREHINKVKNFNQFINENKTNGVENLVLELIDLNKKMKDIIHKTGNEEAFDFITLNGGAKTTVHDELMRKDKEYESLSNQWHKLHDKIYNYYKKIITDTYNKLGEEETKKLYYEIQSYSKQNEQYEIALGVIIFDLTSFTRNLLKKAQGKFLKTFKRNADTKH